MKVTLLVTAGFAAAGLVWLIVVNRDEIRREAEKLDARLKAAKSDTADTEK